MKWWKFDCPALIFFGRSAQRHLAHSALRPHAHTARSTFSIYEHSTALESIVNYLISYLDRLVGYPHMINHEGISSGSTEIRVSIVRSIYGVHVLRLIHVCPIQNQSLSASSCSSSNLPSCRACVTGFSTLSIPFAFALCALLAFELYEK